jgi:hypothetical protein
MHTFYYISKAKNYRFHRASINAMFGKAGFCLQGIEDEEEEEEVEEMEEVKDEKLEDEAKTTRKSKDERRQAERQQTQDVVINA